MPPRVSALLVLCVAFGILVCRGDAQEPPSELTAIRAVYEKELEFATRPIRARYVSRLETLKRSLGARGDARAALAVQEEIDRVLAPTPQAAGFGKFAGTWQVQYENRGTRCYVIKADGTVTWTETDGKPQGDTAGKLQQDGSDTLLELPFSLERISLLGEKLAIEHFAPKTDYPKRVMQRGSGTRRAAK